MLQCRALDPVAKHGFTTRQLALRAGQRDGVGWAKAAGSVGCPVSRIGRVRQVHGADVRVVRAADLAADASADAPPAADAAVTCDPGVAVAVVAADCVPMLLADPATGAVAAVHAGWRGTAANVAGATVATLTREWGVNPSALIAAIGPSIGACCYAVGPELLTAFAQAGHRPDAIAQWFSQDNDRLVLDLWTANRDLLLQAGLRPDHIHVSGLCTQTHIDVFESYRADGAAAGRMAAIIVAPDEGSTPSPA